MTDLETQEQLASTCNALISQWYDKHFDVGFPCHFHICTFDLYHWPYDLRRRKCKEWIKAHPELQLVRRKLGRGNECDYCEMMNFVCVDNEGKIAAIVHPTKEEIDERICFCGLNEHNKST